MATIPDPRIVAVSIQGFARSVQMPATDDVESMLRRSEQDSREDPARDRGQVQLAREAAECGACHKQDTGDEECIGFDKLGGWWIVPAGSDPSGP
jgi:hypothetical protein